MQGENTIYIQISNMFSFIHSFLHIHINTLIDTSRGHCFFTYWHVLGSWEENEEPRGKPHTLTRRTRKLDMDSNQSTGSNQGTCDLVFFFFLPRFLFIVVSQLRFSPHTYALPHLIPRYLLSVIGI